jgi:hypothetical protein
MLTEAVARNLLSPFGVIELIRTSRAMGSGGGAVVSAVCVSGVCFFVLGI